MTGEAEAIQAIDRANQQQMFAGYGLACLGLILFFVLAVRSGRRPVSKLAMLGAAALTLGGLILANSLTYI